MLNSLTWDQFKALVDKKLADKGLNGDVEILSIDTGNYPTENSINIELNMDNELTIY